MQILVNGVSKELTSVSSVSALVEALGLTGRRIAVEVNGDIVSRSRWSDASLDDGDQVEIIHAVGGG